MILNKVSTNNRTKWNETINLITTRIVQHAKECNQLYPSRQIERIPGVFRETQNFPHFSRIPGFVRIPEEQLGFRLAGYILNNIKLLLSHQLSTSRGKDDSHSTEWDKENDKKFHIDIIPGLSNRLFRDPHRWFLGTCYHEAPGQEGPCIDILLAKTATTETPKHLVCRTEPGFPDRRFDRRAVRSFDRRVVLEKQPTASKTWGMELQ